MLKNFKLNRDPVPVKRALLSVFDKTGIVDLAEKLHALGVELVSTGGTAALLKKAGIPVIDISDFTGFPEIMNGRVKTLHPKVAGGILGIRDEHAREASENDIKWIDLVVCNLYPFSEVIQDDSTGLSSALENIDIGGPSMVRSAAKNTGWTTVLVDPDDYAAFTDEIQDNRAISFETRRYLSAKAFGHTAQYDSIIHRYLEEDPLPEILNLSSAKTVDLRYGENPHQSAAAYAFAGAGQNMSILNATIHQGKKLSYNNIMDADGALACIREFDVPACVIVKHASPCGVAVGGDDLRDIYSRAFNADSLSAFGGIVALNRHCTEAVALEISRVFVEVVIAPSFDKKALEIFSKKKNLRVLEMADPGPRGKKIEYRSIEGGFLVQETDILTVSEQDLSVVTDIRPDSFQINTMLFGWKVLRHVKSNGILIAKENTTVGIGTGQVSRVDAVDIAVRKAGERIQDAVLCSDAFFPFRDSIDRIADTGIRAIIQPGGSIRDKEVIAACNEHGISMVFTGARCFRH